MPYTTYKSNSESMSLLIDVLLAIKRCYQNLSLRYQGHNESISRYEWQLHKCNLNELDVLFKFDEWNSCKRGQGLPDMNVFLQIVNQ
jgi:hypothetical protein